MHAIIFIFRCGGKSVLTSEKEVTYMMVVSLRGLMFKFWKQTVYSNTLVNK